MKSVLVLLMLFVSTLCLADGKAFSADILVEKNPPIPTQRAILKYKEGVEMMIVESTISGPKGAYGWIVPVPSKPLYVKPVKPEYLTSAFSKMKPRVMSLQSLTPNELAASLILALLILTAPLRYQKRSRGDRIKFQITEAITVVIIAFIFMPVFAGGSDSVKGLASHTSMGSIGSYEVQAIQDNDGSKVLKWLSDNRFHIPEKSKVAIEAYAKEGWWFVASKFRKDMDQDLPPHPLKVVFNTDKLIYPMRLTGSQEGPVFVQLLAITDKRADTAELRTMRSEEGQLLVRVGNTKDDRDIYSEWIGDIYELASDDDVKTYMSGTVQPHEMQHDFEIELKPYLGNYKAEIFDRDEAFRNIWYLMLFALPATSLAFGIAANYATSRVGKWCFLALIASLLCSGAYGLVWYLRAEKVDTVKISRREYSDMRREERQLHDEVTKRRKNR